MPLGSAQMHEGILPQQGQSTASGTKHTPPGVSCVSVLSNKLNVLKARLISGYNCLIC